LPTHWVVPFEQAPAHVPAVQTYGHAAPLFCQLPLESHICGCCPLHCRLPGVQTALPHEPPLHTYGQLAPLFCHAPVPSHT
jgi:hypothetical protein